MNDFWHTHICNKSGVDGEDWRYIGMAEMAQEALYCAERSVTINLSDIIWYESKTFFIKQEPLYNFIEVLIKTGECQMNTTSLCEQRVG